MHAILTKPRPVALLLLTVACMVWLPAVGGDDQGAGKITYLRGQLELKRGDGGFVMIEEGATVRSGDVLKTTGRGARVEIRLPAKNSFIRIGSDTTLVLTNAMFGGGRVEQLDARLTQGHAYAKVSKLVGGNSSFQIKTGTAVAGVRGTAFRIDTSGQKESTLVRVYNGAVAVSNAPLYTKPGKPVSPTVPKQGVKPGGPGRIQVAGPQQVTKQQWEEIVAKAMQEIVVDENGKVSPARAFDAKADATDDGGWIAWNQSRDAKLKSH